MITGLSIFGLGMTHIFGGKNGQIKSPIPYGWTVGWTKDAKLYPSDFISRPGVPPPPPRMKIRGKMLP